MKSDQNLRNDIRMTLQPFYTHNDDHSIEEMINYLIVLRSLEWTSSTESTGGEMR